MKVNKKAVLSTAAVLGVAGLVAGGTIAYFTDKDTKTNTFTIGDVDITLYESQLHRQNSGRQGSFDRSASDPDVCGFTGTGLDGNTSAGPQANKGYDSTRYCTPLMNANEGDITTITAIANGHTRTGFNNANRTWGYTDATIITDSEDYAKSIANGDDHDGYFTRVAQNIVPGQWVRKFSYVKNESTSSDAYILIRYMVPTAYDENVEVKIPGTPYEEDVHADIAGHQGYFTALTKQLKSGSTTEYEYVAYDSSVADSMDSYTGYVETIDNVEYRVYAAVTTDVVKPGEMTFWSPVNTVRLNPDATKGNATNNTTVKPADQVNVKVDAQAIQAKTFSSALDAIKNLE